MAKAKYSRNSRGYFETQVWDGTYNSDGSKHRKALRTKKSSKALEDMVNEMKNAVRARQYVRQSDITIQDYARRWMKICKSGTSLNTQAMYGNIIEKSTSARLETPRSRS